MRDENERPSAVETPEAFAERISFSTSMAASLVPLIRADRAAVRREALHWRPLTDSPESWPEEGQLVVLWSRGCDADEYSEGWPDQYGVVRMCKGRFRDHGEVTADGAAVDTVREVGWTHWAPLPAPPEHE